MPITVQRFRRLEVWSSWVAGGGTRSYVIPDATDLVALSNVTLGDKFTFTIPLDSAVSATPLHVVKGAVIRLDQDDIVFDEWKVVSRTDDTETHTAKIEAAPFATTDLVTADYVSRLDSDGHRNYKFESVGITPRAHIAQWILPATPGFVTIGTVTPDLPMDMAFDGDKPLEALKRQADTVTPSMELDIRRVGSVGYAIDLVEQIGSGAATCDLRVEKNILRLSRSTSADGQATRVYPWGQADADGARATMALASWVVASIATTGGITTIGLADPAGGDGPIGFDGQLVTGSSVSGGNLFVADGDTLAGIWIRSRNGVTYIVTASSATDQTVSTTMTVSDISVGDLIDFRTGALTGSGNDLSWLDSPPDIANYGIISGSVDAGEIPGHRNLCLNSALRAWTGTLPANWSSVGTPTLTKQTVAPYVLTGVNSIKCVGSVDGDGVVTDSVRITPSAINPYESGYGSVWVVSGSVRVELVFTTPDGEIVQPIPPSVASNSETGQWEDIGISGQDANSFGATAVALRVVQNGVTPATFYIGRGQLTESPAQLPFVEGSGGTKLWQAANELLRTNGAPTLAYEAAIVDLARLDPETWGDDCTITVGGSVLVTDPKLPDRFLTRILEVERSYQIPGNSKITVSNKPDDLSGAYGRPKKKGRLSPAFFATPSAPSVTAIQASIDTDGHPSVLLIATAFAKSLKIAISTSGIPSDATVEASTAIDGAQAVIDFAAVTVDPGSTLYGKAFAYSGEDGGGLRSVAMPFSIPFAALRRDAPWADGGYALAATDSAGLVANSGVTDSSGLSSRRIVLSLAKASSGAPDDLRSVPDGGGYNKTTSSYVDSSGRVITIARTTSGTAVSGDTLGDRTDNLTSTGVAITADIAGINAQLISRGGDVAFREQFDTLPNWPTAGYSLGAQALVSGIPGTTGPNVLQVAGQGSGRFPQRIAFNPSALYRCRIRVRTTVDATAGDAGGSPWNHVLAALYQYDANGTAIGIPAAWNIVDSESLSASSGWITYESWFKGLAAGTGLGTSASIDPDSPGTLHYQCASFSPQWLVNYAGGNGTAQIDYFEVVAYDEVASGLTYGTLIGIGSLSPSTTQGDSAGGRVMLRGRQAGTARNGDSITFDPPYQNIPIMNFHGGALNEPRPKWGAAGDGTETGAVNALPQYEDFAAQGLSASGCSAVIARLRQKGASTSDVTDAFGSPTVLDFGGVGDTSGSATLTHPPALGNSYGITVTGLLDLNHSGSPGTESITATVAIDLDATGTGSWTEVDSFSFVKSGTVSGSGSSSQPRTIYHASLTTSSKFRARIKSITDTSAGSDVTIGVSTVNYTYITSGADQYASKTPDAGDVIYWEAFEAALT